MGTLYESTDFQALLDRLYRAARADWLHYPIVGFRMLWNKLFQGETALTRYRLFRDCYIPVSRAQGVFLYQMVRASRPRRIIEFGTSFGLSTLFLAAALRDNGSGELITTELLPEKIVRAQGLVVEAGLSDIIEFREGDALETLKGVEGPVDMLFLDGWEPQYLPVLQLLQPQICQGGVVLADDVRLYPRALKPLLDYLQDPAQGFVTLSLGPPFRDGLAMAVRL